LLFASAWLALALALLSPLGALARRSLAAHMVEHEILMVVAAPLFVLAQPLAAGLFGLPTSWRRALGGLTGSPLLRRLGIAAAGPVAAWIVHTAALWIWHVPALFNAAVVHEGVHALQHASFFAAALLYWWSVLRARGERCGAAVLSLFATSVSATALGALLTLSAVPWYAAYGAGPAGTAWTPLEDQQLAGLIMWVPACLVYVVAALGLVVQWVRETESRTRAWEVHIREHSSEA
jgi:cytochrome c oxidase assembly factor CtaG